MSNDPTAIRHWCSTCQPNAFISGANHCTTCGKLLEESKHLQPVHVYDVADEVLSELLRQRPRANNASNPLAKSVGQ